MEIYINIINKVEELELFEALDELGYIWCSNRPIFPIDGIHNQQDNRYSFMNKKENTIIHIDCDNHDIDNHDISYTSTNANKSTTIRRISDFGDNDDFMLWLKLQ